MPDEPETGEIIDSGIVVLEATTNPHADQDEEVTDDGGNRAGAGE